MDKETLKKKIEERITKIVEQDIPTVELKSLGELVDIHKDLENEEYWDKKKEAMEMNYNRGGYGEYSEGNYSRRGRDSRGRYSRRGNFRESDEMMEEVYGAYQEYAEGRGSYGHTEAMKSLEYMMQSVVDFVEMLKKDAGSQEEVQIIQKHLKHIAG